MTESEEFMEKAADAASLPDVPLWKKQRDGDRADRAEQAQAHEAEQARIAASIDARNAETGDLRTRLDLTKPSGEEPEPVPGKTIVKAGEANATGPLGLMLDGETGTPPKDAMLPWDVKVIDRTRGSKISKVVREALEEGVPSPKTSKTIAQKAPEKDPIQNALSDLPFAERVGAGKAKPVKTGVIGIVDRRAVEKDGTARTRDTTVLDPGALNVPFEKTASTKGAIHSDQVASEEKARVAREEADKRWESDIHMMAD